MWFKSCTGRMTPTAEGPSLPIPARGASDECAPGIKGCINGIVNNLEDQSSYEKLAVL